MKSPRNPYSSSSKVLCNLRTAQNTIWLIVLRDYENTLKYIELGSYKSQLGSLNNHIKTMKNKEITNAIHVHSIRISEESYQDNSWKSKK